MKNNLPTVTVAISAYNEGQNLTAFLKSVLAQKEQGFLLKNIWVYSDGSTDNTVKIARSIKNRKIKIFVYKKRLGKSTHLNKIYKDLTSDFLVQSDADVVLAHPLVIYNMIRPLVTGKKVAMCGGNPIPEKGQTFIENAVNYSFNAYAPLRKILRGGNNIFSADGRMLSYKKELVKKINIPATMIANDVFTYFCCKTFGYKYKHVEIAIVHFRSPQTIRDQIKQNTRFVAGKERMKEYFNRNLVSFEFSIPRRMLFGLMLYQLIQHPIHCVVIFVINSYCRFKASTTDQKMTALWKVAASTKLLRSDL